MNHFKFHPVGQGLFYTGSLDNGRFNFVYDCGTESKKQYISDAIDDYVNRLSCDNCNPTIDFVVISHLHSDHFNGLYELSQKAHIRKVYLPYLGNNKSLIKVILYKKIVIDSNNDNVGANGFVDTSYKLACQLYGISDERNFHNIGDPEFLGKESENTIYDEDGFCYSGQVKPLIPHWKFVFINKTITLKLQQDLENNLIKRSIDLSVTTLEQIINNGRIQDIVDAYVDTFKNKQNITSTLLYHSPSGSLESKIKTCCEKSSCIHRCCILGVECCKSILNNATLLTGDAEFCSELVKELTRLIENGMINKNVDILQVPHHGSKRNWDKFKRVGIKAQHYVVSFGLGNRYNHPSSSVVKEILDQKVAFCEANQTCAFEYIIY